MSKLVLDLCGGTGSWSAPYRDAGYDVRVIDPQEWIADDPGTGDVRLMPFVRRVHGVLAAPPCTQLAASGARWWSEKGEGALLEGLSVADACCRIVLLTKPKWWALENPKGRLSRFYGPPTLTFHPWEYGDPYTKKTLLWGRFNKPEKVPVQPTLGSATHRLPDSKNRAQRRSATPPGFARKFFEANP